MMKKPDFLHIDDTNSSKLKVIENVGVDVVINVCARSSCRALKLAVSKFRKAQSCFNNWTLVLQRAL